MGKAAIQNNINILRRVPAPGTRSRDSCPSFLERGRSSASPVAKMSKM